MEDASTLSEEQPYQPRVRTMTGGSTGSFSSYPLHAPNMVVPAQQPMPVTPPPVEKTLTREQQLERALEEAQWERAEALEALQQLAKGMRIVTRQIKESHAQADNSDEEEEETSSKTLDEESQHALSCTSSIQSVVSDYDRQISAISHQLDCTGGLGAELLGLSHAANMVGENVRMVSREASDLVQDIQAAQVQEQQATERAKKAERLAKKLYKENQQLQAQLESLTAERKVLVKEVKALHQERAESQQQESQALRKGMLRVMEEYVAGALQVHERQLTLSKPKTEAANGNITNELKEDYVAREVKDLDESIKDGTVSNKQPRKESAHSDTESSDDTPSIRNTAQKTMVPHESTDTSSHKPRGMGFGAAGALGYGRHGRKSWRAESPKIRLVSSKDDSEGEASQTDSKNAEPRDNSVSSKRSEERNEAPVQQSTTPGPYKPVTFETPVRRTDTPPAAVTVPDKKEDFVFGSRVKHFFQKQQEPPPSEHKTKMSLLKLEDETSVQTLIDENKPIAQESRSPVDSPPLQEDPSCLERHEPSPPRYQTVSPSDIAFDTMSDYFLSPCFSVDDSAASSGTARSVSVPFEKNLLRSLAVPQTPLPMLPRPPLPRDDGLYEC